MSPLEMVSHSAQSVGIYSIFRVIRIVREHPGLCLEAWENVCRVLERTKSLDRVERYLNEDVEPSFDLSAVAESNQHPLLTKCERGGNRWVSLQEEE